MEMCSVYIDMVNVRWGAHARSLALSPLNNLFRQFDFNEAKFNF